MTAPLHDLRGDILRRGVPRVSAVPKLRCSSLLACSLVLLMLAVAAALTGCGFAPASNVASATTPGVDIHGVAHGGYFPVSGATVTLWYPGVTGFGSTPTALATTTTGSGGTFSFSSSSYTCPAADMPVYLTITGGNPGLGSTANWTSNSGNSYLALMAAIGTCSSAPSQSGLIIDEATTIAAAFATAQFSSAAQAAQGSSGVGAAAIGSVTGTTAANGGNIGAPVGTISAGALTVTNSLGYTALKNAFATAATLANVATGLAGPPSSITNATVPAAKINTLANILASCVQTDGVAADSPLCPNLAASSTGVTPAGLTLAADTLQMAQYMALSPSNNVNTVYSSFTTPEPVFQSTLSSAPFDWTLAITYTNLGLSYPANLAIDATGDIWVIGNSGTMGIAGVGPTGQSLNAGSAWFTSSTFSSPTAILVDNSGYVWVSNRITGTNDLVVFNPSSTSSVTKYTPVTSCAPGGLTLDPSLSALYDCTGISTPKYPLNAFQNLGSTTSPNINTTSATLSNAATTTSGTTGARGLHSDNSGNIWVAGYTNCTIAEMVPGSYSGTPSLPTAYTLANTYTGTGTPAYDVAIDHASNVWFPCATTLNELPVGSSTPTAFTGGGLNNAQYMAVDGAGDVWVANGSPVTIGSTSYFTVSEFNNSGTAITPGTTAGSVPGGYTAFTGASTSAAGVRNLAIDGAGNVWIPDAVTGATILSELVGAAVPAYTPLGTAPMNNRLGSLPLASAVAPNFSLTLSPQNLTINAGSQQTFTITANPSNGFSSSVTATLSGLPTGVTSDKSSYTLTVGVPTTVTLTAASGAASAIATITATGTSGSLTQYGSLSLTVGTPPDFSVSADPQSVPVSTGSSATFNITGTALNGFSGTFTATLSGLPSGVTSDSSSYTVTPGIPAVVTLTASSGAASTVATVTITGTSGSATHTATITLTVGTPSDYSLSLSPTAVSLVSGSSQSVTVSVNNLNGFSSNASVSAQVTGLPSGVTASPSSFTVSANNSQTVTLSAGSGLTSGNTTATVASSYNSVTHNAPLVVNLGSQTQDFVLSNTNTIALAASSSASIDVYCGGVGGFTGNVKVTWSGLPSGVTTSPSSSLTLMLVPGGSYSSSITLNSSSSVTAGTYSITVTGTSGTLSHSNTVVLTLKSNTTETATINPASPGTAFPAYYIGLSAPSSTTLQEFTGTGSSTNPGFINLLRNFAPYVGSPSIRTTISTSTSNSTINQMAALTTGATFTYNSVTTSPKFYFTTSSNYQPSSYNTIVQKLVSALGLANILGVELDNEPDGFVSNGYRDGNWTFSDYLTESAGYLQAMSGSVNDPGFIATAEAGNSWDPGNPAVQSLLSGQLASFTAHRYAQSACSGTPTIANQLVDSAAHRYYGRFAPLVQTMGSTPVRMGEMNSVACSGYSGVSNTLAASLWLIDTLFEGRTAGVAGFNIHSGGTTSGAQPYDIAYLTSGGSTTVYAPYYGLLFFAQAIQNGAKPIPVTITQASGNIKIWATIDNSNVVRVMVLEKDTDGTSNTHTVSLNLGSGYTATATLTTLAASSVSSTTGITIGGQTFDSTTNGLLTGTATSSSVTSSGGVYTLTVADGSAALLTVP